MNMEQLKGKWQHFKGMIKERWGRLTHDDIEQIGGEYDQLVGRIQERYGKIKKEARDEVNQWLRGLDDTEPEGTSNFK